MQARARYLALRPPGNLARELCLLGGVLFRARGPSARALPPYALAKRLRRGESFAGASLWSGVGGAFRSGAFRASGSWLFLELGGEAAGALGFGRFSGAEGEKAEGTMPAGRLPAGGIGFPLLPLAEAPGSGKRGPPEAPTPALSFRDAELVELALSLSFDAEGRLVSARWEELATARRRTGRED